jgi:hypothetical protein
MPSSQETGPVKVIDSIESVFAGLSAAGYIASRQIATAIFFGKILD